MKVKKTVNVNCRDDRTKLNTVGKYFNSIITLYINVFAGNFYLEETIIETSTTEQKWGVVSIWCTTLNWNTSTEITSCICNIILWLSLVLILLKILNPVYCLHLGLLPGPVRITFSWLLVSLSVWFIKKNVPPVKCKTDWVIKAF